MCGIMGYAGVQPAVPILMNGLEQLQYRGYDSAGIGILQQSGIRVCKAEGDLSHLQAKLQERGEPTGNCGIGHTRWATHGAPTDQNAHPHVSQNGQFAVVHNGILENSEALRRELKAAGYTFRSQTDTECIAHLLEYFDAGDVHAAIAATLARLEGSFALAILCKSTPQTIYGVRQASPLLAARCDHGWILASDATALAPYANAVYDLENGEIGVFTPQSACFFDFQLNRVEKASRLVDLEATCTQKNGYDSYMQKEILEQPQAVSRTLTQFLHYADKLLPDKKDFDRILFLGCGSAYHVGAAGRYAMEAYAGIPCEAEIASEFRYRNPAVNTRTLAVFISQSGETADTLAALRLCKAKGAQTLAIVNVPQSALAREADRVIYTKAGAEIAVATTKAFTAQLAVVWWLTAQLSQNENLQNALSDLPKMLESSLQLWSKAKEISEKIYHNKHLYFLGRGLDFACAMEGSLKLKEISYIHSEAYPAGELKHGTISLITKGTPVFALCTQKNLLQKMASNMQEVRARGGYVIALTPYQKELEGCADWVLPLPRATDFTAPFSLLPPLQCIAYETARKLNRNIDKPRSLAKSVTVE